MTTITVAITSTRPGCPPTECYQQGAAVAVRLKDSAASKSRDGAGWIIGTLSQDATPISQIGATDWVYVFNFDEDQFTDAVNEGEVSAPVATDLQSVCCLKCGDLMVLEKLAAIRTTALQIESFRIFDEEIVESVTRLFRMHSAIEIVRIEASCEEHIAYGEEPQPVNLAFEKTAAQQTGPFSGSAGATMSIDPSADTPLTAALDFPVPLELDGGAAFAVSVTGDDLANHIGLEVHIHFRIIPD